MATLWQSCGKLYLNYEKSGWKILLKFFWIKYFEQTNILFIFVSNKSKLYAKTNKNDYTNKQILDI